MIHELTYREVVSKAGALKEVLGPDPVVYLRDPEPPYKKACRFEPGSMFRLGVNTSGYFVAIVQGITCKWSFDLEGWAANGTNALAPRVTACAKVMAALEGTAKQDFRAWLNDVAQKVRTDAIASRNRADEEIVKAAMLADIAGGAE